VRHRRRKIVPELRRHGKKFLCHDAADGVDTEVLGRGVAAAVAKKAGNGVGAASLERLAEDVLLDKGLLRI
jgi:hypothetical protein